MKNTFVALSAVLVMAAALSLGAFATTVHAEGDFGDYGGWDAGYTDYGYNDAGYTDYGYNDYGYTDYGYNDGGYTDYGYGYDVSAPEGYDVWAPEGYDVSAPEYYDYDYCNCDVPEYSYDSYDSYGSYSPGYSGGYGYSVPSYGGQSTFYAPSYIPQTRTTPSTTVVTTPVNVNNTNTNVNNNNNVNNVNVNVPVAQVTPQPIIQYVQPTPIYQPIYQQPTYPVYNQAPYCTITVTVSGNGLATLYWSSGYATSAYITPSVGNVAPNGSTSLYTYGNTVYTMTVSGQGGSNTCRTQVYAPTTSVSLSQIPYTGFDFGTVGNAIYWMSLLALAISGAYLLVYYKGGALVLASGLFAAKKETVAVAAPVAQSTVVAAPKQDAPKVFDFTTLPSAVETSTKDSMQMVADRDGNTRIVISRS